LFLLSLLRDRIHQGPDNVTESDLFDANLTAIVLRSTGAWLANFHAAFMGEQPAELWTIGTYWHLATRPDEFDALDDSPLKAAAGGERRRGRE